MRNIYKYIDKKYLFPVARQADTKVYGRSCLTDAALLVCNGNHFAIVHWLPLSQFFESLLIHESLKASFGAFVAAFHFSSNPKCRKGSHQTPDSESGPWESHPCRVLRQLRREVSLSLLRFVAVSVAVGYF